MYKKILAAIDLSELSLAVVEQALQLTQLCGAKLILLHVLSSEEEGYPILETFPYEGFEPVLANGYLGRWREFEQQGLEHLRTYANQAHKVGVETEPFQVPGNPGKTICDLAIRHHVDLVIMGNRGRSGLSELLLGSQSNYVIHHAPCSIWVVRQPASNVSSNNEFTEVHKNLAQT